jgi:hypothetical protein
MTDQPIACSLGASDYERRLAEIAAVAGESLTDHAVQDGRHILRFRARHATRERLSAIVAAEADCCPFLDLELQDTEDGLVLTIAAPEEGQPIAEELALAFAGAGD